MVPSTTGVTTVAAVTPLLRRSSLSFLLSASICFSSSAACCSRDGCCPSKRSEQAIKTASPRTPTPQRDDRDTLRGCSDTVDPLFTSTFPGAPGDLYAGGRDAIGKTKRLR